MFQRKDSPPVLESPPAPKNTPEPEPESSPAPEYKSGVEYVMQAQREAVLGLTPEEQEDLGDEALAELDQRILEASEQRTKAAHDLQELTAPDQAQANRIRAAQEAAMLASREVMRLEQERLDVSRQMAEAKRQAAIQAWERDPANHGWMDHTIKKAERWAAVQKANVPNLEKAKLAFEEAFGLAPPDEAWESVARDVPNYGRYLVRVWRPLVFYVDVKGDVPEITWGIDQDLLYVDGQYMSLFGGQMSSETGWSQIGQRILDKPELLKALQEIVQDGKQFEYRKVVSK